MKYLLILLFLISILSIKIYDITPTPTLTPTPSITPTPTGNSTSCLNINIHGCSPGGPFKCCIPNICKPQGGYTICLPVISPSILPP